MPTCVLDLPYDVLHYVSAYLTIREYTCLSLVNHQLHQYLRNERNAKLCLESNDIPGTLGLQSSESGRKKLARIFDRDEALRTAQPYSVCQLATATSFIFEEGTVCYSTHDFIHILDLQLYAPTEKVISSRFFAQHIASAELPTSVHIIGYTASVLTLKCTFSSPNASYLFAIDTTSNPPPAHRLLLVQPIPNTPKLFCVHTSTHLFYGTHSATGSHSHHEWLIHGFSLTTYPPTPTTTTPIQLTDFAGSDLGSTITFTIHNNTFIALSNQVGFESEEINWTSYYRYIQFGLDDVAPDLTIKTIYRRQDVEGPINDAWTSLKLVVGGGGRGDLCVVECRKEWIGGGSRQVRSWFVEGWMRAEHGEWGTRPTVNSSDQVSRLVNKEDNPDARYEEQPRPRIDKHVHREYAEGYDGERREYLKAKTKFAGYDMDCDGGAFVDLVLDEIEDGSGWRKKERVGLRVVSRLLASPLELDLGLPGRLAVRKKIRDRNGGEIEDSEQRFTESDIFKWSPSDGMMMSEELREVMCPGGRAGEVTAGMGFEGLVYLAGSPNAKGERDLLFVSFDSAFGFDGMKRMNGTIVQPRKRGPKMQNTVAIAQQKRHVLEEPHVAAPLQVEDTRKAPGVDKGKQAHRGQRWTQLQQSIEPLRTPGESSTRAASSSSKQPQERLLWRERAQYLSLNRGWWLR